MFITHQFTSEGGRDLAAFSSPICQSYDAQWGYFTWITSQYVGVLAIKQAASAYLVPEHFCYLLLSK
jgi:hypothetical protein